MSKKVRKIIIIVSSIIVFYIGLFKIAPYFLPLGSYSFSERYEFSTDETTLINAIKRFKQENPQYAVPAEASLPNGTQVKLSDGHRDSSEYWFHVLIYYPEKNEIVHFWTRPSDLGITDLNLVEVNKGLVLGNWKEVNKDIKGNENDEEIKMFEERVLDKLGLQYKKKGCANSLF